MFFLGNSLFYYANTYSKYIVLVSKGLFGKAKWDEIYIHGIMFSFCNCPLDQNSQGAPEHIRDENRRSSHFLCVVSCDCILHSKVFSEIFVAWTFDKYLSNSLIIEFLKRLIEKSRYP